MQVMLLRRVTQQKPCLRTSSEKGRTRGASEAMLVFSASAAVGTTLRCKAQHSTESRAFSGLGLHTLFTRCHWPLIVHRIQHDKGALDGLLA